MCQTLLSGSNAVFHFILASLGLKKLGHFPKVTQVSSREWIYVTGTSNTRIKLLVDNLDEDVSNAT